MMISPNMYIDEIKDFPYDKLIKERKKLVKSIKQFEKNYFTDDKAREGWNICPSPDVVYQCELEYLSALCSFMKDKFNKEYVWGGCL